MQRFNDILVAMSPEIISSDKPRNPYSREKGSLGDGLLASLNIREIEREHLPERLFGGEKSNNQLPTSEKIVGHYRVIGSTLTACEASFWKVGIPWLPYTAKQISLRKKPEGESVDTFIRLNLVSVPSDSLSCYLEDLESLPISSKSSSTLSIRRPSLSERAPFFAASIFSCLALAAILHFYLLQSFVAPTLLALVAGWLGLTIALTTCSDPFRRFSFYRALSSELARRSGSSGSGKGTFNVCFNE